MVHLAPDCLFCKIIEGKIPAVVIAETPETLAFLDIHPRAPGHTVVISKHHSVTLSDMPDSEVGPLFLQIKRLASRIEESMGADGLTIGINHGEVSGQTVPHLHVHIIPRFKGDEGGSIHSIVENKTKESLEVIASKIKK